MTFLPAVRAGNTPLGMPDRIGLRDPVRITAVVINPPTSGVPIIIDVTGMIAGAGTATVDGAAQVHTLTTTTIDVQGTDMSSAAFTLGPFLQLGAWWGNHLIGASNRFAVSSIMQDWTVALDAAEETTIGLAFYARMDWDSDSDAYRDLDECRYVELVHLIKETGGMTGMGIGGVNDPDDIVTGDLHPTFDQHGTPHRWTRSAGYSLLRQLFRIRDMRADGGWVASRRSGFEIERRVERDSKNPRCWQLTVTKAGADVSAGGLQSAAGSGRAVHTFPNLNCDPPPPPPTPVPY